jgi:hypothetical protein
MTKKAQAAMEFLMSYGWAVLVILTALSALAYFGVLSPHKAIPETCILIPGLGCDDYKVDTNGITLIVRNGLGFDLESFSVTVLGSGACGGDSSSSIELKDGQVATVSIVCTEKPKEGTRFVRELEIRYRGVDGLDHIKKGDLSAQVEA